MNRIALLRAEHRLALINKRHHLVIKLREEIREEARKQFDKGVTLEELL